MIRIPTYALGIVVLFAAAWVTSLWRAELIARASSTVAGYQQALAWNPESDEYHAVLGTAFRDLLDGQDLDAAVRELRAAVRIRPMVWTHHESLAITLEIKGDPDGAEAEFNEELRLNPHHTQLRWQAANFFLRRGNLELALEHFRAAAEFDPSRLAPAADRLTAAGATVEQIGAGLVPQRRPDLMAYLYFVLDRLPAEPERAFRLAWNTWLRWEQAPRVGAFHIGSLDRFMTFLLRHGEYEKARQVWNSGLQDALGPASSEDYGTNGGHAGPAPGTEAVYNGGFEAEALNGGFDWTLPAHPEVYYEYDHQTRYQGLTSLRIDFAGKSNLNYSGPRQVLLLPAGKLQLRFIARSENVTSDQGVCFELRSFAGNTLLARSAPILGNSPWQLRTAEFEVERPTAAVLTLRRYPSEKFNNLLGGRLWLDAVEIR